MPDGRGDLQIYKVPLPFRHMRVAYQGVPGARLEEIKRVYSHPQALAQAEEFLSSLGVEVIPVHDTAGAARMVAEAGEPDQAAVASVRAGSLQGLAVLAERIQTYPDNFT